MVHVIEQDTVAHLFFHPETVMRFEPMRGQPLKHLDAEIVKRKGPLHRSGPQE
jgi:hypothetical protein